jgi:hypothetical protein
MAHDYGATAQMQLASGPSRAGSWALNIKRSTLWCMPSAPDQITLTASAPRIKPDRGITTSDTYHKEGKYDESFKWPQVAKQNTPLSNDNGTESLRHGHNACIFPYLERYSHDSGYVTSRSATMPSSSNFPRASPRRVVNPLAVSLPTYSNVTPILRHHNRIRTERCHCRHVTCL